jgi:hypothetical protein
LNALLKQTGQGLYQGQNNVPSLSQQYANYPGLQVPGLTAGEGQAINNISGLANSGPNAQENAANQSYLQMINPNSSGYTAQTQNALQNFTNTTLPQLQSQAALSGLGNSPALAESIAMGQSSALAPLLAQQEANQGAATTGLANLGSTLNSQFLGNNEAALQAQQVPYDIAAAQAQALYQQQAGQQGLAQQIQTGPASLFGNIFGQNSTSTTTPNKF